MWKKMWKKMKKHQHFLVGFSSQRFSPPPPTWQLMNNAQGRRKLGKPKYYKSRFFEKIIRNVGFSSRKIKYTPRFAAIFGYQNPAAALLGRSVGDFYAMMQNVPRTCDHWCWKCTNCNLVWFVINSITEKYYKMYFTIKRHTWITFDAIECNVL
jgi:hypothetical protein